MANEQPSIPVGYVRRPHGIGGDVVVRGLVSDADDRFVEGASLRADGDPPRRFDVESVRPHQGDYLVTLAGVASRSEAEQLVGTQFVIGPEERRELGPDEWWAEDLVGCSVVTLDRERIGEVEDVVTGSAQDRLVVGTADGQRFEIPLVDELVPSIDTEGRRVIVDLPDGLVPG